MAGEVTAQSDLIHESDIPDAGGLIHESQIGAAPTVQAAPAPAPQPMPTPTPAPSSAGLIHENDIQSQGQTDAPTPTPNRAAPAPAQIEPSHVKLSDLPGASTVAKTMALLDKLGEPVRQRMKSTIAVAAYAGVPGAQDLYKHIIDNPDPHFHDISNYVYDKVSTQLPAQSQDGSFGIGELAKVSVGAAKVVTGVLGDMVTDPATYIGVGELTEAAQAARMAGQYGEKVVAARDVLTYGLPGARKVLISGEQGAKAVEAIKATQAAQAVSQAVDTIADTQLGRMGLKAVSAPIKAAAKVYQALSPYTAEPEVNFHLDAHAMQARQQQMAVKEYLNSFAEHGMTAEEKPLAFAVAENVPNLRSPNLPEDVIKAAGGKISATEEQVRAAVRANLPTIAKEMGVSLDPARAQALEEVVVKLKKGDAFWLEAQHQTGKLTAENVNDFVRENHMPHVRDPIYSSSQEDDLIKAKFDGPKVSGRSINKQRMIEGSVSEINKQIEKSTGKAGFFIEDPVVATAMRMEQAQKLLRDKPLIDIVKKYGVEDSIQARRAGLIPIDHPDFKPKNVALPGSVSTEMGKVVQHAGLVFDPDMATKMSHYLGAKPTTNIVGSISNVTKALNSSVLGKQNSIFKAQVFTAPALWARNALDNLFKGAVSNISFHSWKETSKIILTKLESPNMSARLLTSAGKDSGYTVGSFWKELESMRVFDTSSFKDGMDPYLSAAKKALLDQSSGPKAFVEKAKEWAKGAMGFVGHYGEKGENFSRAAFMHQKIIEEGFDKVAAYHEMQRVFFDYTRNSPLTDSARFFFPFIQHPIKTVQMAPELIGKNPGYYNALHNSFPQVLANAMGDPMSQQEFNSIAPDWLKEKNPIAGPIIHGKSWLAYLFGAPDESKGGGAGGMQLYLTPGIGMSIADHLLHPGMSPTVQSLYNYIADKNGFGEDRRKNVPGSKKWNAFLWDEIHGTLAMPNATNYIKQLAGIGNPDVYQPLTVHLFKAATSQFGGAIDIDKQAHYTLQAHARAYGDLIKNLSSELKQEVVGLQNPNSYASWFKQKYPNIIPTTNAEIYAEAQKKIQGLKAQQSAEDQMTRVAQSFARGQVDVGQYVAHIKGIEQNLRTINQNIQFTYQRLLDMSKGARNAQEARAKAGVKPIDFHTSK